MAVIFDFSEEEKNNLRSELPKVLELIESNGDERAGFFKSPFKFLRQRFNIFILRYFAESRELIEHFDNTIRYLFERLRRFLNICALCKMTAVLMIYAILGHFGGWVILSFDYIDTIITKLEEFFGKTGSGASSMVDYLRNFADSIKPAALALAICEDLGICHGETGFNPQPVFSS